MPVKEKVNKSAEIRKLHASGLKSASEIVAKLKDQGIKATPALVCPRINQRSGWPLPVNPAPVKNKR